MSTTSFIRIVSLALALAAALPACAQEPPLTWVQRLEGNEVGALFGWSVANVGDVDGNGRADLLVGAPNATLNFDEEGAVYLFLATASGYSTVPNWSAYGGCAHANFGWSVSGIGDFNGDSRIDVAVGAPGWTNGQSQEGRLVVYYGQAGGTSTPWISPTPAWSHEPDQADAHLGHVVGSLAAFNNDSRPEVFATAPDYDRSPFADAGIAWIWFGSTTAPTAPSWNAGGTQDGMRYGYSAASVANFNADANSRTDFAVGSMNYDNPSPATVNAGRVDVYWGAMSAVPSNTPIWTYIGSAANQFVGGSIAGGTDLNSDSIVDMAVGAWSRVGGEYSRGTVLVFNGMVTYVTPTPAWTVQSQQDDSMLGFTIAQLVQWNADPRNELSIGAELFDTTGGGADAGKALIHIRPDSTSPGPIAAAYGENQKGMLSQSIASAGRVNNDAYYEMVVGAPWFSGGQDHEGAVYLYWGNP